MMHLSTWAFVLLSSLVSLSLALPRQVQGKTVITSVSPASTSCAGAPYSSECRTADQAAAAIATSFNTYGITSPGEMAAIIATMAFESGDFKYQKNHFPGRPGQGTRNMQMASYNLKYVQSIPSLASPLAAITGTSGSVDYDNAVLGLVISSDVLDFGSGAWFLASQCSSAVRSGLQSGNQAGFEAYVRNCVQTDPTSDRLVYWKRAIAAL